MDQYIFDELLKRNSNDLFLAYEGGTSDDQFSLDSFLPHWIEKKKIIGEELWPFNCESGLSESFKLKIFRT